MRQTLFVVFLLCILALALRGDQLQQALNDGEDYELLFAVPPRTSAEQMNECMRAYPNLEFFCIGRMVADVGHRQLVSGGWDHFQK